MTHICTVPMPSRVSGTQQAHSKSLQNTHSFIFYFFFYFKILDVITFIQVSACRVKGYGQKKSFWSIKEKSLSSRYVTQRVAEISWHLDQNILWKTLSRIVRESYVEIQILEARSFAEEKEIKRKPRRIEKGPRRHRSYREERPQNRAAHQAEIPEVSS